MIISYNYTGLIEKKGKNVTKPEQGSMFLLVDPYGLVNIANERKGSATCV